MDIVLKEQLWSAFEMFTGLEGSEMTAAERTDVERFFRELIELISLEKDETESESSVLESWRRYRA